MTTELTQPTALPLGPGRWELDIAHSGVTFSIRHLGVSKIRGRFGDFDADVVIGDSLGTSSVSSTVAVASLDTGNADRDDHVLGPDLVDVATRPTMTYRSTSIVESGNDYRVEGELTIGDVTRPVGLDLGFGGIEEFFDGRRHAGFEATTQIRRTDFGIGPDLPPGVLGDVIRIVLDLQLMEPR